MVKLNIQRLMKTATTRNYFLKAARSALKEAFIDHERRRKARISGGLVTFMPNADIPDKCQGSHVDVTALHAALSELENLNKRRYETILLRFFLGLKVKEVATILGVSEKTVELDSRSTIAWLRSRVQNDT